MSCAWSCSLSACQQERHIAYSETRYTADFGNKPEDNIAALDNHRLRVPCEALTYELTGIDPQSEPYFTFDELRKFQLSQVHQTSGTPVTEIAYHESPDRTTPPKAAKRLVEQTRTLFFNDNLNDPLPFNEHGRLGLPYENYKLAFTDTLLDAVFKDPDGKNKLSEVVDGTKTARDQVQNARISGYLSGAALASRFPGIESNGQYWIRSGIAGFAPDAKDHFYLPEKYIDPFDNITMLAYDGQYDLFIQSNTDMLQNKTQVVRFDFRVLAPREMKDINDNLSEVFFDVLGLPTAMAVKGKGHEGDDLNGFPGALAYPLPGQLTDFFVTEKAYDDAQAKVWLDNATARHIYYFGEVEEKLPDGSTQLVWGQHPACACGIVRERHVSQLGPGEKSPIQSAFEYSDGMGNVVVKKVQAEPEAKDKPLRWIASGKTILNNKDKPVKQYEPYFSVDARGQPNHRYEEPKEAGVTSVIYYDAVGRTTRTEMPDGSFSRIEFSPWHVRTFDQNDTVKESQWYANRNPLNPDQPLPRDLLTGELSVTLDQRAAWLAAQHAGTPALTILDSLGRDVVSIAHNRIKDDSGGVKDEKYLTFNKLDAEGKPLWIRDARKNLVMQYINPPKAHNDPGDAFPTSTAPCYDIAGNLLFQHSMDAGNRWMINDAAGKPMLAWNNRGHVARTDYDQLHRPIRTFVKGANPDTPNDDVCVARTIYGEQHPEQTQRNLRGRVFTQLDQAGAVTSDRYDFKGNLLQGSRRLASTYRKAVDWKSAESVLPTDRTVQLGPTALNDALKPFLESETFTSSTRYDALNRPVQLIAPHSDRAGTKLNVTRPAYNEANLLERIDVWLEQASEPTDLLNPTTAAERVGVQNIDYNAKGQRTRIDYKNSVSTTYEYDSNTFRLIHLQSVREGQRIQDLFYTYDPMGNITTILDKAQEQIFHSGACVNPGGEYIYDPLYRLIAAAGREHKGGDQQPDWDMTPWTVQSIPNDCQALRNYVETYRYDAVGNIMQMRHHQGHAADQPGLVIWNRRYQYAVDSNQLLATSLPADPENPSDYTTPPR